MSFYAATTHTMFWTSTQIGTSAFTRMIEKNGGTFLEADGIKPMDTQFVV